MATIYRSIHGDHHYTLGIAASDLGSVYEKRKDYARAEQSYREAIRRFIETQSADHMNTGINRIKLGRTLLAEHRYAEAERESLAGYQIVARQAGTSDTWLQGARMDLAAESAAVGQLAAGRR